MRGMTLLILFFASAKFYQAVLKQFSGGLGGSDNLTTDDNELQLHQKLEKLYISTRAAKVYPSVYSSNLPQRFSLVTLFDIHTVFANQHYQRDVIRGVEGYIVTGFKQVEIGEFLNFLFY